MRKRGFTTEDAKPVKVARVPVKRSATLRDAIQNAIENNLDDEIAACIADSIRGSILWPEVANRKLMVCLTLDREFIDHQNKTDLIWARFDYTKALLAWIDEVEDEDLPRWRQAITLTLAKCMERIDKRGGA